MLVAFLNGMIKFIVLILPFLTLLYPYSVPGIDTTINNAKELLNKGKATEVIELLRNHKPPAEDLSVYHYTLARAFEKTRRFNDYIEHLRLAYIYTRGSERSGLLLERADTYIKMGYYSEASLILKIFLMEFPDHPERSTIYTRLGDCLYNLGRYEEALSAFSKGGNTTDALFGMAKSLQSAGKIKEAEEAFAKAILTDKEFLRTSEETLFRYAENLAMLKRFDSSKELLKSIKDSHLRSRVDLLLGIISSEEKKYVEALKYLDSALSMGKRETKQRALYEMAQIYRVTGRVKESEGLLIKLRLNYPYGKVYDRALLSLVRLYREAGQTERAIPLLKELVFRRLPVKEAIDEIEAIILSEAEAIQKKPAGTVSEPPRLLQLWKSLGHWLLEPSRAETILKVVQALKESGTTFTQVSKWLLKNGDNNTKEKAAILLASFYADYELPERAEDYMKLLKGKKTDDFYRLKARVSFLKGNLKEAVNALLSIRNAGIEDLYSIAEVIDSIKDTDSVDFKRLLNLYKRTIEKSGTGNYIHLADLLYNLNNKDEALSYYKKALNNKGLYNISDLDWACYRINRITQEKTPISMIQGDMMKRLGETILKDADIEKTIKEVL